MLSFFRNKKKQKYEVGEFAHANRNLLIIVADPEDDTISVFHQDRVVGGRIKTAEGKKAKIVKELLSVSKFENSIDPFILGVMDALRIRRMTFAVNNFLQFLDGAIFNIAKRHRKNQTSAGVPEGAVKSPLSVTDVVGPQRN